MKVGVEVKVIAFGVERQKHLLVELKLAKVLAVESERAHNVVVVAGLSAAVAPVRVDPAPGVADGHADVAGDRPGVCAS